VIRVRAQLVKARTLLVNTARGAVKGVGARLLATDADAFHNTSWKFVPEGLREAWEDSAPAGQIPRGRVADSAHRLG
jgi:hypothetical protein